MLGHDHLDCLYGQPLACCAHSALLPSGYYSVLIVFHPDFCSWWWSMSPWLQAILLGQLTFSSTNAFVLSNEEIWSLWNVKSILGSWSMNRRSSTVCFWVVFWVVLLPPAGNSAKHCVVKMEQPMYMLGGSPKIKKKTTWKVASLRYILHLIPASFLFR